MGKRTSVYLTDAQTASLAALGTTMAEVVRAGLNALVTAKVIEDLKTTAQQVERERRSVTLAAGEDLPGGRVTVDRSGWHPAGPPQTGLYPCCTHCTPHPAITADSHTTRCQQCPA